jgi:CMP-N-acetylneuraminic acid synthetase
MKRLCTICVRGGSKGVPRKNAREIAGLPLVVHSIRQAQQTSLFDLISVSSDDEKILQMAKIEGVASILRPEELAMDTSPKLPAIVHAVLESEKIFGDSFETVVDLDATSPLRILSDINGAVNLLERGQLDSVFTASESKKSPFFNQVRINDHGLWSTVIEQKRQITRRQDSPKVYDMNASIYVWRRNKLIENPKVFYERTEMFEMPGERSLDIDSELDFWIVERIMEWRKA